MCVAEGSLAVVHPDYVCISIYIYIYIGLGIDIFPFPSMVLEQIQGLRNEVLLRSLHSQVSKVPGSRYVSIYRGRDL